MLFCQKISAVVVFIHFGDTVMSRWWYLDIFIGYVFCPLTCSCITWNRALPHIIYSRYLKAPARIPWPLIHWHHAHHFLRAGHAASGWHPWSWSPRPSDLGSYPQCNNHFRYVCFDWVYIYILSIYFCIIIYVCEISEMSMTYLYPESATIISCTLQAASEKDLRISDLAARLERPGSPRLPDMHSVSWAQKYSQTSGTSSTGTTNSHAWDLN